MQWMRMLPVLKLRGSRRKEDEGAYIILKPFAIFKIWVIFYICVLSDATFDCILFVINARRPLRDA